MCDLDEACASTTAGRTFSAFAWGCRRFAARRARIAATGNRRGATDVSDAVTHRLLAMALVTACTTAGPVPSTPPFAAAPSPVCPPVPAAVAEVVPPAEPEPAVPDPHGVPDRTAELGQDDVLLQLDYESTFGAIGLVDFTRPFGSMPAVTLYRDGTVIANTPTGAMWWNRGEHLAANDLEHVHALGAAKIKNHTGSCVIEKTGKACVSDASIVHVRMRTKKGTLRDLANYAGFSNTHATALTAIYDRLEIIATLPSPTARRAAQPWIPVNASLFLRFRDDVEEIDHATLSTATPWPLAPDIFERAVREQWIVVALDRPQVLAIVGTTGTTGEPVLLRLGNRAVMAGLVPWMPGEDHREAIAKTRLPK